MAQSFQERRQTPRFSFAATAVIKTAQGPEVTRVRVLGLGIAGCRIAVPRPLEVDQEFELTINPNGEEIVMKVVVRYWHTRGFAGLHFTSMSGEAKKRLERLADYISKTSLQPETSSPA